MSEIYFRNVIEAALLAAGRPLTVADLGQVFTDGSRPEAREIRAALERLGVEYEGRGIELKETASGFRIQVRSDLAAEVSRLWPERPRRYSRALLETLALIAYRQPITRAEIEAVRGVAVNPDIVKTLLERNWVRVVGHRDVPGHPELLGTTREFLDYFGLRTLDELPPLAELRAMADLDPQLALPGTGAATAGAMPAVAAAPIAAPEEAAVPAEAREIDALLEGSAASEEDAAEEDELSASGEGVRGLVAAGFDREY
jgi:segregation and condensation protein B